MNSQGITYLVQGRIFFDDDDTVLIVTDPNVESQEDAEAWFVEQIEGGPERPFYILGVWACHGEVKQLS